MSPLTCSIIVTRMLWHLSLRWSSILWSYISYLLWSSLHFWLTLDWHCWYLGKDLERYPCIQQRAILTTMYSSTRMKDMNLLLMVYTDYSGTVTQRRHVFYLPLIDNSIVKFNRGSWYLVFNNIKLFLSAQVMPTKIVILVRWDCLLYVQEQIISVLPICSLGLSNYSVR